MKKNILLSLSFLCLAFFSETSFASPKDSIGIEKINGKIFILHKVEAKETFYSLSRRYNVSIEDIVRHNPETELGLKIDNIIKIPYKNKGNQTVSKQSHTVAPSQTLFSISRLYGVSVEDIKKWNDLSSNDLNVGQTLVIYNNGQDNKNQISEGELKQEEKKEERSSGNKKAGTPPGKLVHTVEPSQTLYAISQLYEVSVEDIKKWNKLSGNSLEVGQQLTIKIKSQPDPYNSEPEKPVVKMEEPEQEKVVRLDKEDKKEEEKEKVVKNESAEIEKKPASRKENSSGFKKIVELGMAEVIEDASDTKKYVALHRTAPIGTIMQVTNEMNSQNVFVRVIGKLPETGVNDKVLIKLSKPAFERLGAVNNRFPAEISYVP